ncbi:MAG: hypothetical protein JWL83_3059 [Actinomycetia bacterium]|nr:hypothetical protein [Actinomycetes bacterium]
MREHSTTGWRVTPTWSLGAVAVLYGAAQFVVVGVDHYFGFDEAVYYSKSSPRVVDAPWGPIRALGLPWLLRPITTFADGATAMRWWLLALTSIGLFIAFFPWVRRLGWSAVVGAALFASSWLALYFGSAAYPNLPMALAVVGGTGWAVTAAEPGAKRVAYAACAIAFAVAATIRPTDALLQFTGVTIVLVVARRRHAIGAFAAGAAGMAIGWSVWVVEAYRDFGGPVHRWHAAFDRTSGFPLRTFVSTTAVVPANAPLSSWRVLVALTWWAAIAFTAAYGLYAYRRRDPLPVAAAIAAAAPLLAVYVLLPSSIEARFLIPVYASLAVASGTGVYTLAAPARRDDARLGRVARVAAVVLLLVAFGVFHVDAARRTARFASRRGRLLEATGTVVRRDARGAPCLVGADENMPVLGVASGCATAKVKLTVITTLPTAFARRSSRGTLRYLVARSLPPPGAPFATWRVTTVETQPGFELFVFVPPGQR